MDAMMEQRYERRGVIIGIVMAVIIAVVVLTQSPLFAGGATPATPMQGAAQATTDHHWWSGRAAGFIGGGIGSGVGLLGGLLGASVALGAGYGVARAIILTMLGIGVGSLVAMIAAFAMSQPYHVWYPFMLIGLLCTVLPICIWPGVRQRYQQKEMAVMQASDATS